MFLLGSKPWKSNLSMTSFRSSMQLYTKDLLEKLSQIIMLTRDYQTNISNNKSKCAVRVSDVQSYTKRPLWYNYPGSDI